MRYCLLIVFILLSSCHPAIASVPIEANQYKRQLIRVSHADWGLDAPVALFAAQIHQESLWQVKALSYAGAQGLAQFMPNTAKWLSELYPILGANQPYNSSWALSALVIYDRWHYQRLDGLTSCDRWAFVLSAYNGGLTWVKRDKAEANKLGLNSARYWGAVESINSGRSISNFQENRNYPLKIIYKWQPLYVASGWGAGVCL